MVFLSRCFDLFHQAGKVTPPEPLFRTFRRRLSRADPMNEGYELVKRLPGDGFGKITVFFDKQLKRKAVQNPFTILRKKTVCR